MEALIGMEALTPCANNGSGLTKQFTTILRRIVWSDCTCREQELLGVKAEETWKFDSESGTFRRSEAGGPEADLHSDLKWQFCLKRRGLAMDQALLLSWDTHEKWLNTLISHKFRKPPPGYSQVSWEQLNNADAEIFKLAGAETGGGIRPDLAGVKPLDSMFERLMNDHRVTFFLLPLPKAASSSYADSPAEAAVRPNKAPRLNQKFDSRPSGKGTPGKGKTQTQGSWQPNYSKKGKGKGNGKKGEPARVPEALRGCKLTTNSGGPVCFSFNMGGCQDADAGKQCWRGHHLCCAQKCKSRHTHGFADHDASKHE